MNPALLRDSISRVAAVPPEDGAKGLIVTDSSRIRMLCRQSDHCGCERGITELSDAARTQRGAKGTSGRGAKRRVESGRKRTVQNCRALERVPVEANDSTVCPAIVLRKVPLTPIVNWRTDCLSLESRTTSRDRESSRRRPCGITGVARPRVEDIAAKDTCLPVRPETRD